MTPGRLQAAELTLRLLIWEGYAPLAEQAFFSRKIRDEYGVTLKFSITHASNPDDFFNELRKGHVELISPAHNLPTDSRYNFTTNGLTLPYNLENVPNYKDIAPELQNRSWAMEKGRVYAVPIVQGPYGLAYNADIVKPEPLSWNILWDPRYAGQYVVARDYYELSVYVSALALGYSREKIFHYDRIKGHQLEKHIRQLAVNAHAFWVGFDKPEHLRGNALGTSWRSAFPELRAEGENWRIAVPREGTTWWIDTLMLSHTLKRRPLLRRIAEEWVNHVLDPRVQAEAIARPLGIFPVTHPGLKLFWEKASRSPDAVNQKRLLNNHIAWQVLKTRDRNAFNLLWSEAMQARMEARNK